MTDTTELDLAVAVAEGLNLYRDLDGGKPILRYWLVDMGGRPTIVGLKPRPFEGDTSMRYSPSTNWAQGGPIMEREKIVVLPDPFWRDGEVGTEQFLAGTKVTIEDKKMSYGSSMTGPWTSEDSRFELEHGASGPTYLIAAMRSYLLRKSATPLDEVARISDELGLDRS